MTGRTVVAVLRRGKQLVVQLSGPGPHAYFHQGMTGDFAAQDAAGRRLTSHSYMDFKVDNDNNNNGGSPSSAKPAEAAVTTRNRRTKKTTSSSSSSSSSSAASTSSSSSSSSSSSWPPQFHKCVLTAFPSGVSVAYTNIRRFGRVLALDGIFTDKRFANLGPDPLVEMPPRNQLVEQLRKRKGPVKGVLLDQVGGGLERGRVRGREREE